MNAVMLRVKQVVRSPLFLGFVAGCFSALSMAPFNLFPVLFLGLSTLYVFVHYAPSVVRAFFIGGCFAFGYFVFSLSWVANALLVEGNGYAWAYPLAICGLPLMLTPFTGLACAVVKRFCNQKKIIGFLGFVAILSVFEYMRGHLFTGFPWNLYGYTWNDVLPIAQIAAVSDIYGLTMITIFWAASCGFLWLNRGGEIWRGAIVSGLVVVTALASYTYGAKRINKYDVPYRDDIRIKIAAPYIPQAQKWDKAFEMSHFQKHLKDSQPVKMRDGYAGATYIVWPETAVSQWFLSDPRHMAMLTDVLALYDGAAYILTGMLRYDSQTQKYFNALTMINAKGEIYNIYDKHHLVPFGEYIPFNRLISIPLINQFSAFGAGDGLKTLETPESLKYSPLVCYEVIFPGQVISLGDKVDFMVNVTNDSWYVGRNRPEQHAVHARFRAIEEGIPLIRSSNGSFSGIFDVLGRVEPDKDGYYFMRKSLN
jgi:apolipoprotein N-acyltransferase